MLKANPYYWREGQPYLDGVVFEFEPDANTRTKRLRSGEVDVADGIPYKQVEPLDETDGITVEVADALKWDSVFLNTKHPPLDEVEVRQALNYATPKEEIRDAILYGNARVANSNIPPIKYWDESIRPYRYDLDKAKELIAESSVPEGFDLDLEIPSGDAVERKTAMVLEQEWGKIGVDVNIVPRDFGTMFTAWLAGEGGEAATFPGDALSSDTLSDDEIAALTYDPEAGLSGFGTFYENPRILNLLADCQGHARRGPARQGLRPDPANRTGRGSRGAAVLHRVGHRLPGRGAELRDLPDRLVAAAAGLARRVAPRLLG